LHHLMDRGAASAPSASEGATSVPARALRPGLHSEAESKAYLAAYGLPVTVEQVVSDPPAAVAAAERIGYPVALKVSSDKVAHKSDAGGVLLDLRDAAAVRAAARTLGERFPGAAMLVQQMVSGGVELIVGAQRTQATGPVIMLGIGGIFAEVLDDVVFCRAPASRDAVHAALARLRAQRLLDGYRGMPVVDRNAVADIAARLSAIVAANPSIVEVDLNPVIASADGAVIVDALIRVEEPAEKETNA
jgi:acetate---CoA ligase (ADP-forming)